MKSCCKLWCIKQSFMFIRLKILFFLFVCVYGGGYGGEYFVMDFLTIYFSLQVQGGTVNSLLAQFIFTAFNLLIPTLLDWVLFYTI